MVYKMIIDELEIIDLQKKDKILEYARYLLQHLPIAVNNCLNCVYFNPEEALACSIIPIIASIEMEIYLTFACISTSLQTIINWYQSPEYICVRGEKNRDKKLLISISKCINAFSKIDRRYCLEKKLSSKIA